MAPEMFKVPITASDEKIIRGRPSDIWAAGITLYNLLTKKFPFHGSNIYQLSENIMNQEPDFTELLNRSERNLNESLVDLLTKMLDKDPDCRIGIYEIINHPWVTDDGQHVVDLDLD